VAATLLSLSVAAVAQYGSPVQNAVFPVVTAPTQNPITAEKAVLGKMIFWDEQLSNDNTMACGTCHRAEAGGADPRTNAAEARHPGMDGTLGTADDRTGSPGVTSAMPHGGHVNDGTFYPAVQVTGRRAPTAFDRMFETKLFWDGRANDVFVDPDTNAVAIPSGAALENLSLRPLLNEAEMGCINRTIPQIIAKLQYVTPMKLATNLTADMSAALAQYNSYADLFNAAFGTPDITAKRIAYALATYMRKLTSNQTPFDQFVAGNNNSSQVFQGIIPAPGTLTQAQVNGLAVFNTRCTICHEQPMFGNSTFAVAGLNDPNEDPGRFLQTFVPADFGKLKIPSLRNVGLREGFGLTRSGRYDTLEAVVESYANGGTFLQNISTLVTNPNGGNVFGVPTSPAMTATEKANLVDFLRNGLTDPRAAQGLAPFDRPTLASEVATRPVQYGNSNVGTGGFAPEAVTPQPPALGTINYTVGVANGNGGAIAVLALSTAPAPAGTTFNGTPLHVSPFVTPVLVTVSLQGNGAGEGYTSLGFSIPDQPNLDGFSLYGQWFVVDTTAQGGLAATPGFQMTLF
jgi:cytochrome c peroxidase